MELTGLSLGQLLALFAGTGAVTTALYLLKLRRRTVVVPFVALWGSLLANKQATSLFSRLKRLWSLLLALLLIALMALSLGDPRHTERSGDLRHYVLLVDAGITMQTDEGDGDRLRLAIDQARSFVDRLGSKDRALIAQMDRVATPFSAMTNDAAQLNEALASITATDVRTDIVAGIALAQDVLRGKSQPEIVLLTDGASYDGPPLQAEQGIALRQLRVGKASTDVGISAFAVRRFPLDKTRSELLVEVRNLGEKDETLELKLTGDSNTIDVQRVEVAAGQRKRLVYDNITGVDRALEASLSHIDRRVDALAANNRAFATLPERNRLRVLCVTEGNRYLEAALLLDEYLEVDVVNPGAFSGTTTHDVVIFDRNTPAALPSVPAVYVAGAPPQATVGPLEVTGTIERPYFAKLSREHPLLRHVALGDVNIASALKVTTERTDTVVGADTQGPLLVAGERAGIPFVVLTFDVTQSDLPLRVAWPMLLLNALDSFASQQVGYVDNYRAGERGTLALTSSELSSSTREWIDPNGKPRSLAVADNKAIVDVNEAGLYTLRHGDHERRIAVNPGVVGAISPRDVCATVDVAKGPPPAAPPVREQPWSYLLMAVLAILAVEWFTFHRRWTV